MHYARKSEKNKDFWLQSKSFYEDRLVLALTSKILDKAKGAVLELNAFKTIPLKIARSFFNSKSLGLIVHIAVSDGKEKIMRKTGIFMFAAMVAAALSGCGAPAGNSNSNGSTTNSNRNKTTAAAPTADTLLALDKQATEAYFKGDSKFFEGFLSEKFAEVHGGMRFDKAMALKMIGEGKCDVKPWTLEEPRMSMVDSDTYVLSYKGAFDGTCANDGKSEKIPGPIRAATVFVRNGDKWQAAFHGENVILDPKNPQALPAEPKKEESTKEVKIEPKPTRDANAAPATPAPVKSPNTDALVAVEKGGWEAWKTKDAKKLDAGIAKNMAILASDGSWMARADAIKFWVEMPCENITTVDVKDGFGIALSPTTEMLTFVGTADGACFGQKNTPQDSMSVYVKEDGAWKMAFGFSAPTM
jgi:Domain of unknown function (DUF4440)